jgi:hypothetical protein
MVLMNWESHFNSTRHVSLGSPRFLAPWGAVRAKPRARRGGASEKRDVMRFEMHATPVPQGSTPAQCLEHTMLNHIWRSNWT